MPEPLRLFILAGEASGDRIGADLVERLRRRREVELSGVGGSELAAVGLGSMFPMRELSVMGWTDVLPRLPLLLWRARQVAQAILATKPDVVVLIDAQEFSRVVAHRVRRAGSRIPMLLYVAPAVWAWKPDRARFLGPLFDEVLSVLPFEPAVMARLDGPPTTYVGHPALAGLRRRTTQPERGPLLLLPGSREGALRRHLPLMREIAGRFATHPSVSGIIVPATADLAQRLAAEVKGWPTAVQVAALQREREAAFREAVAAVAVSGTITLELALAGVPMVATYVGDRRQGRQFQKYGAQFAALPNIILRRPVVPEILGYRHDTDRVAAALEPLLAGHVAAQLGGFFEIRALMEKGAPEAPLVDPAERVLAWAQRVASGV